MINMTEGELVEGVVIRIAKEGELGENGKRFDYNYDEKLTVGSWKAFSL